MCELVYLSLMISEMRVALLQFIDKGITNVIDYPDGYEEQKAEDLYQIKMTGIDCDIQGQRGDVFDVVAILSACKYGMDCIKINCINTFLKECLN